MENLLDEFLNEAAPEAITEKGAAGSIYGAAGAVMF
jgi:hypothetical protein